MDSARLYFSFSHIELENFPEGTFRHRRITPLEAKHAIDQACLAKKLLCVCKEDLLAPFHQRERQCHQAICQALNDMYSIALSEADFLTPAGAADRTQTINPLFFAKVQGESRLIVVRWNYVWHPGAPGIDWDTAFTIEPSTIEFHLFEQA